MNKFLFGFTLLGAASTGIIIACGEEPKEEVTDTSTETPEYVEIDEGLWTIRLTNASADSACVDGEEFENDIESEEYPAEISLVGTNGILVNFVDDFPMEGEVTTTGFWTEFIVVEEWSSDSSDTAEGMEGGSLEVFMRFDATSNSTGSFSGTMTYRFTEDDDPPCEITADLSGSLGFDGDWYEEEDDDDDEAEDIDTGK